MPGFGPTGSSALGLHGTIAAPAPAPTAPTTPTPEWRVLAIDAENRVLSIFK